MDIDHTELTININNHMNKQIGKLNVWIIK